MWQRTTREQRRGNPFNLNTTQLNMSNQLAQKNDLRSLIASDKFKEQVALALPKHMTPDRFARVALTALTRTPKLMECTRESLLRCLMDCSSLGLEPDGRNAHLIPYKDTCTLIIDYKGLIALARRSGDVAIWRAELVKSADVFQWKNGTVTHSIDWRQDRGKTQCVYSYVRFNDGAEDWEVMTLSEVEAIRKRSRSGNNGPWVTDFDEMAKKTVMRRHSKRLTLSPEFADALEKDDDREARDVTPVPTAKVPQLFQLEEQETLTLSPDAPSVREELQGRMNAAELDFQEVAEMGFQIGLNIDAQIQFAEQPEDALRDVLNAWDAITAQLKGGAR